MRANPWSGRILSVDEAQILMGDTPKKIHIVGEHHLGPYTEQDIAVRARHLPPGYLLIPENRNAPDGTFFHGGSATETLQLDPLNIPSAESQAISFCEKLRKDEGLHFTIAALLVFYGIVSRYVPSLEFINFDEAEKKKISDIAFYLYIAERIRIFIQRNVYAHFRDLAVMHALGCEGVREIIRRNESIVIHTGKFHGNGLMKALKAPQAAEGEFQNHRCRRLSPETAIHSMPGSEKPERLILGANVGDIRFKSHRQVFNALRSPKI